MINLRLWRLCRAWLMRHDGEARAFWRGMTEADDLEGAVRDNLRDFGPDVTGQAAFILEVLR
jgi:hypothetical protein